MVRRSFLGWLFGAILFLNVSLAKDFLLTPVDFPVMGELDPIVIDRLFESNPDDDGSYGKSHGDEILSAALTKYNFDLFGGPMLGHVTDTSASFWLRTLKPAEVQIVVRELGGGDIVSESTPQQSKVEAENGQRGDLVVVPVVEGLSPETQYTYEVLVDGEKVTTPGPLNFSTFPKSLRSASFTIAFGGGARYVPESERVWDTIATHHPIALLLLGDNVYHDIKNQRQRQRVHYYRRQLREEFVRLTSGAATYAIWDDHDFCGDDCGGGYSGNTDPWRIPTLEVFRENWGNPSFGGGEEVPGVWFKFTLGPVEFFMLDSRYYRNKGVTSPSMLGDIQKEWLKNGLLESKAAFKVIVSPVPMARGVKPGSQDPWDGYQEEREEIFATIDENDVNGVFLLAADRHRSDVWRITRENGYDLYEFMSSRLTNLHKHPVISNNPDMLFGYSGDQSFGLLHFDFENEEDPEVVYEIRTINNEEIHKHTLKRSELGEYTPLSSPSIKGEDDGIFVFTSSPSELVFEVPGDSRTFLDFEISNLSGQKIFEGRAVKGEDGVSFSFQRPLNLIPGVYVVGVSVGGKLKSQKFTLGI